MYDYVTGFHFFFTITQQLSKYIVVIIDRDDGQKF